MTVALATYNPPAASLTTRFCVNSWEAFKVFRDMTYSFSLNFYVSSTLGQLAYSQLPQTCPTLSGCLLTVWVMVMLVSLLSCLCSHTVCCAHILSGRPSSKTTSVVKPSPFPGVRSPHSEPSQHLAEPPS